MIDNEEKTEPVKFTENLEQAPPPDDVEQFTESNTSLFDTIKETPGYIPPADLYEEEEEEEEEPDSPHDLKRIADLFASVLSRANATLCGMLAQESAELFSLTESEKKEFSAISADYFAAGGYTPGPEPIFFIGLASIFGGKWAKAIEIRKKKKKGKAPVIIQQGRTNAGPPKVRKTTEAAPDLAPAANFVERTRFDVDEKGRYIYSLPINGASKYVKKADREHAPENVVQLFKAGYSSADIKNTLENE